MTKQSSSVKSTKGASCSVKRDSNTGKFFGIRHETQAKGKSTARSNEIIRKTVSKHSAALIRLADR